MAANGTTNGTTSNSCFSTAQSTVLKGVSFGGVPIVLLLDFTVFLVCCVIVYIMGSQTFQPSTSK